MSIATAVKPNDPTKAKMFFEEKVQFTTGPVETERMMRENGQNIMLIDVRATEDYQKGHAKGAINLPENQWESMKGLSKDKQNIVYCYSQVCHLAAKAALKFAAAGYPMMEMEGGMKSWMEHELPMDR